MDSQMDEITQDLKAWAAGDDAARERLIPKVYEELHRMARRYAGKERAGQTLQATVLVNEAYLKLVNVNGVNWQDRIHFFAVAARTMRRILVDSARARAVTKRGGGLQRVQHTADFNLDALPAITADRDSEMVAIDDALHALTAIDPRKAEVVEMRFFGGMSVQETAEILKISPQTVMRDWKMAKAWLLRELGKGRGSDSSEL